MNNKLKEHWEEKVPKGHKHFIDTMDVDKINRLKNRVNNFFITKLNFDEIKTAYDWGCGGGLHTKTLSEICDVIPLDISNESLLMCEKYTGIKGKLVDEVLPNVDLIFCADVIHHFPSLEYLNDILTMWLDINPKYMCLQYKVSDVITDNDNYYEKNNYLHSLFLKKDYLLERLPSYSEISYNEEKSKNGEITHGFLVIKRKD
jgi:predicted TPR repeat methyltransferase